MRTRITYYRGIPLSMIHDLEVELDGKMVPREDILFSADGEQYFTLAEMETVTTYKWEYGEEATVFVKKAGGLPAGEHTIKLIQTIRTEYIPVPFTGKREEKIVIR